MDPGTITCPNCGHAFEISDALTGRIREHLREELFKEVARREADIKKRNESLKEQEAQIAKSREAIDEEIEKRLKDRLVEVEQKAASKLEGQLCRPAEGTAGHPAGKGCGHQRPSGSRNWSCEKGSASWRTTSVAGAGRGPQTGRGAGKNTRGSFERRSPKNTGSRTWKKTRSSRICSTSLEDMKRKAEQGSMETQGEVLEQDFEAQLKAFFVHDDIQPVPKGIRGADLVHNVRTPMGVDCGILLWETKNTKAWSQTWIPKLKDDMIEIRATIAILVSVVLPEGIKRFGRLDGVWVSDPLCAIPLAAALREQLMAVNRERTASIGKSEKMEALYQYLAGVEFKQKIEGIVEAFTSMQDQLNKERRAMERHWKQREKEIERVVKNTVGLYGDMQGIIGGQIPVIPALELEDEPAMQLPDGSDEDR